MTGKQWVIKIQGKEETPFSSPWEWRKGFSFLEPVRIFLEVIGGLTLLKYVFGEAKEVVSAAGRFISSIKKVIYKIKNSQ